MAERDLEELFAESAEDDARAAANRAGGGRVFHAPGDTNLFGGAFTPFKDLWNSAAADLGITTKRMRNDALARAAEEESIWRDTSSAITEELGRQRAEARGPDDLAQLRVLQTQLDLAGRLRASSNPKLHEAGIALLGKVTDAQRAFGEQQETQRIAQETREESARALLGPQAWARLNEVADDLRTESTPFLGQKEAWGRIKAAALDPTESGDYALLYSLHKMLDPASTVLASEFQNSQNLAGVPEFIVTMRNMLHNGERLTPERRAGIVKMAEGQYRQSSEQQAERNSRYLERARAGGVPEEYLNSLQIPVFSPGELPTSFGEAPPRPVNVAPEERTDQDSTATKVGQATRSGAATAADTAGDFLKGLLGLDEGAEAPENAAPPAPTREDLPALLEGRNEEVRRIGLRREARRRERAGARSGVIQRPTND